MARGGVNGDLDRISSLPDSILLEILSSLPFTKDAIQTCVLSKRLSHLWTQLQRLSFRFTSCNSDWKAPQPSVTSFATSLIKHASPRVTHLHITVDNPEPQPRSSDDSSDDDSSDDDSLADYPSSELFIDHFKLLLIFARWKRVEVFSLDYAVGRPKAFLEYPQPYIFRRDFNPWSSVREFKTVGCNFEDTRGMICSGLRVLDVGLSNLSGHNRLEDVLSSCPHLESLRLFCCKISCVNIMSSGLKKLIIEDIWDDNKAPKVQVSAPLLKHLELVSRTCSRTSYKLIDVSSLVVANIDLHPDFCSNAKKTAVKRILKKVRHVKELKMGTWCIKALSTRMMQLNLLPAFSCMCLTVHLSQGGYYACPGVKGLLRSSSMIEKLVLNFEKYGDGGDDTFYKYAFLPHFVFDSSINYLKIIHVHGLHDSHENLYILEFLLKHATALQEMVVHDLHYDRALNMLIFAKKLLDFPKSSPAAVVRLPYPYDVDEEELASL